jgi:hypothetical protein
MRCETAKTTRPTLLLALASALLASAVLRAEPVQVRHTEGLVHGFLLLRTLDGKTLAEGDLTEHADGDIVTNHLVFHFKDGSLYDETAVFSQSREFRLLKDHLVQKGPAFQHSLDSSIDTSKQEVTIHYTDKERKEQVMTEHVDLPLDLANGIVLTLLKNIPSSEPLTKVSMVAATPKPRVVNLAITPAGEERFSIGDSSRKATRYKVKVEIGGVTGWFAHLMGKIPPPTHVWILSGDTPAFVKSEGPLFMGGPIWRIELASPTWSHAAAVEEAKAPQ